MSLFKISEKYLEILEELNAAEGEITPDIANKLDISEIELKEKAINYAYYIKKLELDNKIIDEEIARLKDIKTKNENKINRVEHSIIRAMVLFRADKIESPTLKLSLRKSESVTIFDESKLSDNFFTTKITKTISKTALKDAFKSGAKIEGAELIVNQNLQIK